MIEESKIPAKTQREFKTGTVPYKIDKPFYDFIDSYNERKQVLDELIQAKNKKVLQSEKEEGKNTDDLESELREKLKFIEQNFEKYMMEYLKKYKEDPIDYNEIYFPAKRTAAPLVDIISTICKEIDIATELRSGNTNKKTISVYKSKPAMRNEKFEKEEETLEKKENVQKNENVEKKQNVEKKENDEKKENVEKPEKKKGNEEIYVNKEIPEKIQKKENDEESKNEYKFPPDPIKSFTIKSVSENEIVLLIEFPDDNGDKITEYDLYDLQKNLVKKSEKNEIILTFAEDVTKCSRIVESGNFLLSFLMTAKNSIGESKSAIVFQSLIRPFQKNECLMCGKEVPLNGDLVGELSQFSIFFEGRFKKTINKLCMRNPSLMLLDGGILVQWGYSIDSSEIEIEPQRLPELVEEMISTPFFPLKNHNNPILVNSIACGNDFCAAITLKGEVLTWGLNSYGQLGHGDFKARPYGTNVKALSKEFCIEIAAGLCHCLALTEKGQVYVWGFRQAEEGEPILDRFKNVIDYENKGHHQVTPRLMKTGIAEKIKNISCGGYHNLILSEKGALYSWGDNESGQLGQGVNSDISSNVSSLIPKKIEALVGKEILKVACGESHSIVITKEKGEEELWSWGNSQDGQCGLGDFENKWLPKKINKIWKEETKGISAGKSHSLFLTKGNQVYGCGETKNGAFGKLQDVGKRVNVPFLLNIELNEKEVIDVVAGHNSSAILFK